MSLSLIAAAFWPIRTLHTSVPESPATTTLAAPLPVAATSTGPVLSLPQDLWISALEYCESKGDPTAINITDVDGTSSYYSFQFKPDTFIQFGVQYGVLKPKRPRAEYMELMKDRLIQREIVSYMVLDKKHGLSFWQRQFPGCVKKFGRPPMK